MQFLSEKIICQSNIMAQIRVFIRHLKDVEMVIRICYSNNKVITHANNLGYRRAREKSKFLVKNSIVKKVFELE